MTNSTIQNKIMVWFKAVGNYVCILEATGYDAPPRLDQQPLHFRAHPTPSRHLRIGKNGIDAKNKVGDGIVLQATDTIKAGLNSEGAVNDHVRPHRRPPDNPSRNRHGILSIPSVECVRLGTARRWSL